MPSNNRGSFGSVRARPGRPVGAATAWAVGLGLLCAVLLGIVVVAVAGRATAATPSPAPGSRDPRDLSPFAEEDPRREAADRLKSAIQHLEDGDLEAALSVLARDRNEPIFAADLVAWTRGEALALLDRPEEAEAAWARIPKQARLYRDALLRRAESALSSDRPEQALAALRGVDFEGGPGQQADVLRARAFEARGGEGDEGRAYSACKRVWLRAGAVTASSTEAEECMQRLKEAVPAGSLPNLADRATRSKALGGAHQNGSVIALLQPHQTALEAALDTDPRTGCTGLFQLGRAFHKKRLYTQSVPLMATVAERCSAGLAVKGQYLLAEGQSRSGRLDESVASYTALADRFPEHSYADDGLYNGGRLLLAHDRADEARALFTRMADEFPEGDMLGKGLWGMAWAALQSDQPDEALRWLERIAQGNPLGPNRGRVLQARYWQARTLGGGASANRGPGIEALAELAASEPLHYYGVLALWQLSSLDAGRAARVARALAATQTQLQGTAKALSSPGVEPEPAFLDQPGTRQAIERLRGGFTTEAGLEIRRALGPKPSKKWSEATLVFAARILEDAGDPHHSHNLLRQRFRSAFPPLSEGALVALERGYPLGFAAEIGQAMAEFGWSPLLFHALVREESAYAPTIVSWAGAIGLSQLMWPTAKETARKMGNRNLKRTDLDDPTTNVSIGSTYLNGLHRRWKGHLPLAIASYNAGPGAVSRWVDARGDLELDAWVETIPYDQTRHYVKRVLSSFQIYNVLYGDGLPYVPLRVGAVREALSGSDPGLGGS